MSSDRSDAVLRVYIDFKSPEAYLAIRPTLALSRRRGWRVDWLPCDAPQEPTPVINLKATDPEDVGERHRRVRAAARRDAHLHYAALQGAPMRFPSAPGETALALAALMFARETFATGDPTGFVEAAFEAYWAEGANLNDVDVIVKLLAKSGGEASGFDAAHYLRRLNDELASAGALGVLDAPTYLVGTEMFIGRQHLPLIERLTQASNFRGVSP